MDYLDRLKATIRNTAPGNSGASWVGLPSLDDTIATVRTFIDGVSSSLYYTGGTVNENAARLAEEATSQGRTPLDYLSELLEAWAEAEGSERGRSRELPGGR